MSRLYTQLKDLVVTDITASRELEKVILSGKTSGKVVLFRQVEAKIDVTLSHFISILPSPKCGKQGAPVEKTRN